jgi:4-hydroxybenzoate polyprenyltransferase
MTPLRRAHALLRAGHPGPCLAITGITVLLAVAAGTRDVSILATVGLAVLAGQLSIGWSNDHADAARDAVAGRTDKPLASGELRRPTVLAAALGALLLAFALALAVGPVTAAWLVPVVGGGWVYNVGLKATPLSGLAYVVGFGPLPGLATSLLPGHPLPRPWALAAASLLGLGAHFANVLPDLTSDGAVGVRGLPHWVARRGGERAVRLVAVSLLLGASALIAPRAGWWLGAGGLSAAVALGLLAVRARGRAPFRLAIGIAALDVALFALSGAALT